MEWLEFERWSPEVEQRLALQGAWLCSLVRRAEAAPTVSEAEEERACRFRALLQRYPPTNPWGHPPAEC